MRIITALGAIVVLACVVTGRAWQHASHGKQVGAVLAVAAIWAALEVGITLASRRGRPARRPASPLAPARRR